MKLSNYDKEKIKKFYERLIERYKHEVPIWSRNAMSLDIPARYAGIIRKLVDVANKHGYTIYAVGGFVRDILLDRDPHDLDILVEGPGGGIGFATKVAEELDLSDPVTFPRFGTAMLKIDGETIDFVMPRQEYYTEESRKPETTIGTLEQDAKRRDFSINALFLRLNDGQLLDLTGHGLSDLKEKRIRVTDPEAADVIFSQDPLRMLRAIRQSLQLGFDIDPDTLEAIKQSAPRIKIISEERIRDELSKILVQPNPSKAIRLLEETGLLKYIIPELEQLINVEQPTKWHSKDVWEHTLQVLDNIRPDLIDRLSALLHDIGKPATKQIIEDTIHFFGHAEIGSELAKEILRRLKFPNEIVESVAFAVGSHMRPTSYDATWTDSAVRRFIRDMEDYLDHVLTLAEADITGGTPERREEGKEKIRELRERIEILESQVPTLTLESPLDGNELMELFDAPPGPWIKEMKEYLISKKMENPALTKEEAIKLAKEYYPQLKSKSLLEYDSLIRTSDEQLLLDFPVFEPEKGQELVKSCIHCLHLKLSKSNVYCDIEDEVIAKHGFDNFYNWLENVADVNDCSFFEAKILKKVESDLDKEWLDEKLKEFDEHLDRYLKIIQLSSITPELFRDQAYILIPSYLKEKNLAFDPYYSEVYAYFKDNSRHMKQLPLRSSSSEERIEHLKELIKQKEDEVAEFHEKQMWEEWEKALNEKEELEMELSYLVEKLPKNAQKTEPIEEFDKVRLLVSNIEGYVIHVNDDKPGDVDYIVKWDKPLAGEEITEVHPSEVEKVGHAPKEKIEELEKEREKFLKKKEEYEEQFDQKIKNMKKSWLIKAEPIIMVKPVFDITIKDNTVLENIQDSEIKTRELPELPEGGTLQLQKPIVDKDVEKLQEEIYTDQLTGLRNRKFLMDKWNEIQNQYKFLALIDIDHFKEINDEHGHLVGDEILKQIANILRSIPNSLAIRWGGEEIICFLNAKEDAELIRKTIEEKTKDSKIPITVSIGVTLIEQNNYETSFGKADKALRQSKEQGRNKVTIYTDDLQDDNGWHQIIAFLNTESFEMVKMSYFPDHPEKVKLKSEYCELKEKDIYNHWKNVQSKLLPYLKDFYVMTLVKVDDMLVHKRNDEKGKPIKISTPEDYEKWIATGGTLSVHAVLPSKTTTVGWIELDPREKVPFEKVKKITKELYEVIDDLDFVEDVSIRFSGSRGFHLFIKLHEPKNVDELRKGLKEILDDYIKEKNDPKLTTGVTKDPESIRLDVSTLKYLGSLRAPFSIHEKTGLVTVPITFEELDKFEKEDAKIPLKPHFLKKSYKNINLREDPNFWKEVYSLNYESIEIIQNFSKCEEMVRLAQKLPVLEPGYKGKFVIHLHETLRRPGKPHFDLRLEWETEDEKVLEPYKEKRKAPTPEPKPKKEIPKKVLRSWAIPKAKLPEIGEKLLTVEVEPHDYDYLKFEGTIPAGSYGAGEVTIYDTGKWELIDMTPDKITFKLEGDKIEDIFSLIKTKDTSWLLIKPKIKMEG